MTSDPIVLTEGDAVTYTITCKKDGSVQDLTGVSEVRIYVHDNDVAEGTNIIDDATPSADANVTTIDADPTTGQVTFAFTTAMSTISGSGRVVKGIWKVKADNESYDEGEFRIEKDAFTA